MSKKYAASCVLLKPLNENLGPFFAADSCTFLECDSLIAVRTPLGERGGWQLDLADLSG